MEGYDTRGGGGKGAASDRIGCVKLGSAYSKGTWIYFPFEANAVTEKHQTWNL